MIALDCHTLPFDARVRRLRHMCRSIAVRAHAQATPVHEPEAGVDLPDAAVAIIIDWSQDSESGVAGKQCQPPPRDKRTYILTHT